MPNRSVIRILLVDDDPEDLELTEDVLHRTSRTKFLVTLAEDPQLGLELLRGGNFDIALVDYEMGVTNGLELLQQARREGCQIPVILLTGHQADSLAEDALGAGVADYLDKGTLEPILLERVVLYAIERMRAYRELDDAANRIRFMLDATPGIAWEADSKGRLLYVSKRWLELVGDNRNSQTLFEAVHSDDLEGALESWRHASESGTEWRAEYRLKTGDGGFRWVLSRASRGDPSSESSPWIGLSVTVDEQKQLEQQLQARVAERTAELEEMQREIESVSYSMVHDMRSPVRAIIATSSELLEDFPDMAPGLFEGLKRQKRVGRHMHALVDGMIQYIRLIRAPLEIKTLDASALCNEVVQLVSTQRTLYGAKINVASEMKITGDPAVLKILIEALLDNAIKFRPDSRPNEVWITQAEASNGLCIADNGIGFDPLYLHKILLPFERLHREDQYDGVGIGLALARRAVGRHNGTLSFESAVDQGVKVCFILLN